MTMDEGPPIVRIECSSRPEWLMLVRSVLAGVGELLSFDAELIVDLKTAVSEACSNVVLHAYSGAPGPLLVDLRMLDGDVQVTVRDRGTGIQHVASPTQDRMGVGLAVISALADRAEFLTLPSGGTEVRMSFADRGWHTAAPGRAPVGTVQHPVVSLDGDVVVTVAPVALLAGVLGRACRALAASARFSLDRFSDIYLITDAIAAHAQATASTDKIRFGVAVATRRLEVTIGPLRPGSTAQLQQPDAEASLARLTDALSFTAGADWEMVQVLIVDHQLGPSSDHT
jgi:anti-sigma regulatory factor (Ser/Thr protein kinase)